MERLSPISHEGVDVSGPLLKTPRTKGHLEHNKAVAIRIYDPMFNQSEPAVSIRYGVGASDVQQVPEATGHKQAFIDYFDSRAREYLARVCGSRQ